MSDKNEKAMRLYEAMEGVDPELLARSEKKAAGQKKIIPFQRHLKAMAACIALVVVGTACWATLQNGGGKKASGDAASPKGANYVAASDSQRKKGGKTQMDAVPDGIQNSANLHGDDAMENEAPEAGDWNAGAQTECCEAVGPQKDYEEDNKTDATGNSMAKQYNLLSFRSERSLETKATMDFQNKRMEIAFGQEEAKPVKNQQLALMTYEYLKELQIGATEEKEFSTDYVTIRILDEDGNVTEAFCVSGVFLKLMGLEDTYEILNNEYDYYELLEELFAITEEEN